MSLLLVDATNVTMRYAYAQLGVGAQSHPDLDAFEKVAGGAEYACRKVARQFGATHAVLCFDSDGETFRHKLFPDYKKSRPAGSFKWSKTASNFMTDIGWKCVAAEGYEGDDVVATLAQRAHEAGKDMVVFSGDCDLLQLAGIARCVQFGQKKEPKYAERSAEWVCEKYDLPHIDWMPAYKALVGDNGDDLPGVRGIGPQKASKIIKDALSRSGEGNDSIYDAIEAEVGEKKASASVEQFGQMLHLVSLRIDVPIKPIVPSECRIPVHLSEGL